MLFHFMLKALFVLKIFKFLSRFFEHVGKRFDKKAEVNFKLMTSQIGKQIITIYILPNISSSNGNQARIY